MPSIAKSDALSRTKLMLHYERNIPLNQILSASDLRSDLAMNDTEIGGLERPIETEYFADQNTSVTALALRQANTVADLRDVIWDGTP